MQIQKIDQSEFDRFNRKLADEYGYFDGIHPRFRLIWSEDCVEKRLTHYTKEGLELITPEVIETYKYRQWKQPRYIIEMMSLIGNNPELAVDTEINYEPFYTFEDRNQEFLIPRFDAAKIIIDAMLEIAGVKRPAQYNTTNEAERAALIKRVDEIEYALYGNETKITDNLARDSAVGYGKRSRNDGFDPAEKVQRAQEINNE